MTKRKILGLRKTNNILSTSKHYSLQRRQKYLLEYKEYVD